MDLVLPFFEGLRFNERGLIPAVVQEESSGQVLMHVYMNREALERSLEAGIVHYYSERMRKVWQKGEASGHRQRIRSIRLNCDSTGLLIKVEVLGGACEEGYHSCYIRSLHFLTRSREEGKHEYTD
jgi:phosphoribosyl-AMP cyclohydrolase